MPFPVAYNNVLTIPPGAGLSQRIVVDGVRGAIFEYDADNNFVGSWASTAGTDPYGNPYPAGFDLSASTISGMIEIIIGSATGSSVTLNPNLGQAFNISQTIGGTLQAALQLTTTDSNEVLSAFLAAMVLTTSATPKMATVLTSPLAATPATGAAMVLLSENDGGTDTAGIMFGTISTPDDSTEVFTPILLIVPFGFVLYSASSGIVTVTKTSGSGSISVPASSVVKAECWGPGAGGAQGQNQNQFVPGPKEGGVGGGAGAYSQEPNLVTPPSGLVTYVVGSGGTGGLGGFGTPGSAASTITGASATVTANPGQAKGPSNDYSTAPPGGTASSNTISNPGGAGSFQGGSAVLHGLAGGSSAGPGGAGTTSGAGRQNPTAPPAGGAIGGTGGSNAPTVGTAGAAPGAGGGGGGVSPATGGATAVGGNGANGQVRVTYTTGAPAVLLSAVAAGFTDPFGTAIAANINTSFSATMNNLLINVLRLANQASAPAATSGETILYSTSGGNAAMINPSGLKQSISGGGQTGGGTTVTAAALTSIASATINANDAVVGAVYELVAFGHGTTGSTAQLLLFAVQIAGATLGAAQGPAAAAFPAAADAFRWAATARIVVETTGSGGTAFGNIEGTVSIFPGANLVPGTPADFTIPFVGGDSTAGAMNTTAAQTLGIAVQWGSTTGAPTITCDAFYMKRVV
jgi:hypothetical protein